MRDGLAARTFLDALTEHLDAIDQRDIDRFAATIASDDDVRFVGGNGSIVEGRENAVEVHRAWFAAEGWTFDPQILWTREEGNTGFALTRVDYTDIREDGTWKMLYDQSTTVAE